jgi:hypothetical protein
MRSAIWTWVATGMLVGVAVIARLALAGDFATDWRALASGQVAAVVGVFGLAGAVAYGIAAALKRMVLAIVAGGGGREA